MEIQKHEGTLHILDKMMLLSGRPVLQDDDTSSPAS